MRYKTPEEKFMNAAIREARKAEVLNEVPIGCVIVRGGKIIARGYNKRVTDGNVLSHAEIIAIKKACRKTGDWRLEECELYVTLEPCPMCAGAIVQARIPKVYIGSMWPVSIIRLRQLPAYWATNAASCSRISSDRFAELIPGKSNTQRSSDKDSALVMSLAVLCRLRLFSSRY